MLTASCRMKKEVIMVSFRPKTTMYVLQIYSRFKAVKRSHLPAEAAQLKQDTLRMDSAASSILHSTT